MCAGWPKKPNKQKKSRVFLRPGGRPTLDGGGGQWSNIRGETKKLGAAGKNNTTVTGQQPACFFLAELQKPKTPACQ